MKEVDLDVYSSFIILACIKDSQKINKKTKFPGDIDEGWNSQKQLSGPVEKKKEETLVSLSNALTRYSYL